MRKAIIANGVVANVIEIDPADIPGWAQGLPDAGEAGPGWSWDGTAFSPPPEPPEPEPGPDPVPVAISRLQAKAVLLTEGVLPQVEALVAQAGPLTQLAWAEAVEFRRDSPTIASFALALEWDEARLDDLFRAGAALTF